MTGGLVVPPFLTSLYLCLESKDNDTFNRNHYASPFVLTSIAFIRLHISQCSGQQSWKQVIFIELQAKHQTSLGVENDEDYYIISRICVVSCII